MAGRCLLCDDAPAMPDRRLLDHMRREHQNVQILRGSARARAVTIAMLLLAALVTAAVLSPLLGMLLGLFVRGFNLTA